MSWVSLSFIVHYDKDLVHHTLKVKKWQNWDRNNEPKEAVDQDHKCILKLQDEVIQPFWFEKDKRQHERKQEYVDWEESNRDSAINLIVRRAVLESDNVHPSYSVKIVPVSWVSVDEHRDQERQKHDVENVDDNQDEDRALRIDVVVKLLVTSDTIEYVLDHFVDSWLLWFELTVKLSADDDESNNQKAKRNQEFFELIDHWNKHCYHVSKLLCSLKHNYCQNWVKQNKQWHDLWKREHVAITLGQNGEDLC